MYGEKTKKHKKIILFTDGGSKGNPGPAGIGILIFNKDGKLIKKVSEFIGKTTNNVAEYTALLRGLDLSKEFDVDEIEIKCDSKLMVNQLKKKWKVKSPNLKPLYQKVRLLLSAYRKVSLIHVPRSIIKAADKLVNKAINSSLDKDVEVHFVEEETESTLF